MHGKAETRNNTKINNKRRMRETEKNQQYQRKNNKAEIEIKKSKASENPVRQI